MLSSINELNKNDLISFAYNQKDIKVINTRVGRVRINTLATPFFQTNL